MAFKPITNPRGAIIQGKNGKAELIWNAGCAPRMNEVLSKKQEIIDSEVLNVDEIFEIPMRYEANDFPILCKCSFQ